MRQAMNKTDECRIDKKGISLWRRKKWRGRIKLGAAIETMWLREVSVRRDICKCFEKGRGPQKEGGERGKALRGSVFAILEKKQKRVNVAGGE